MPREKVQAAGKKGGQISKRGKATKPTASPIDHGIIRNRQPRIAFKLLKGKEDGR